MTLGILTANVQGYVPVLLVVWNGAFSTTACCPLGGARSSVEMEAFGRALADQYSMGSGLLQWSNILDSGFPPWIFKLDPLLEHQDAISCTEEKKRERNGESNQHTNKQTDRQNSKTNGRSSIKQRRTHKETHAHLKKRRGKKQRKEKTKKCNKPNEQTHR